MFAGNWRFRTEACAFAKYEHDTLHFISDGHACMWYANPKEGQSPVECLFEGEELVSFTIDVKPNPGGLSYKWTLNSTVIDNLIVTYDAYSCVDDVSHFYGAFYVMDHVSPSSQPIHRYVDESASQFTNDRIQVTFKTPDNTRVIQEYHVMNDHGVETEVTPSGTTTRHFRWKFAYDTLCFVHVYLDEANQVTESQRFCPSRSPIFKQRMLPPAGYYSFSPEFYLGTPRTTAPAADELKEGWWWPGCEFRTLDNWSPTEFTASSNFTYVDISNPEQPKEFLCNDQYFPPADVDLTKLPVDYTPPFLHGKRTCTYQPAEGETTTLEFTLTVRPLEDGSYEFLAYRGTPDVYPTRMNADLRSYLFPCTSNYVLQHREFALLDDVKANMDSLSPEERMLLAQSESLDFPCVSLYEQLQPSANFGENQDGGTIVIDGDQYRYLATFPTPKRVKLLINGCSIYNATCDSRRPNYDDTNSTLPELRVHVYERCDGVSAATFVGSFLDPHGNTQNCQLYDGELEDYMMVRCNLQDAPDLAYAKNFTSFEHIYLVLDPRHRIVSILPEASATLDQSVTYPWTTTPSGAVFVTMRPIAAIDPDEEASSSTWWDMDTFMATTSRFEPVGRQTMFAEGVFLPTSKTTVVTSSTNPLGVITLRTPIPKYSIAQFISPFAGKNIAITKEFMDGATPKRPAVYTYTPATGTIYITEIDETSSDIHDATAIPIHGSPKPARFYPHPATTASFDGVWHGPFALTAGIPFALGVIQGSDLEVDGLRPLSRNVHEYWRTAIRQAYTTLNPQNSETGQLFWESINTCRPINADYSTLAVFKAPSFEYNDFHDIDCNYEFSLNQHTHGGFGKVTCDQGTRQFRWTFPSGATSLIHIHYWDGNELRSAVFIRCLATIGTTPELPGAFNEPYRVQESTNALNESLFRPSTARGAYYQYDSSVFGNAVQTGATPTPLSDSVFVNFAGAQGDQSAPFSIVLQPNSPSESAHLKPELLFDELRQNVTLDRFEAYKDKEAIGAIADAFILPEHTGSSSAATAAGAFRVFAYPAIERDPTFVPVGSFGPKVSSLRFGASATLDPDLSFTKFFIKGSYQFAIFTADEIAYVTPHALGEKCKTTFVDVDTSTVDTDGVIQVKVTENDVTKSYYFTDVAPGLALVDELTPATFAQLTDRGHLRIAYSKAGLPATVRRTGDRNVVIEEWIPCVETASASVRLRSEINGNTIDWTSRATQEEFVSRFQSRLSSTSRVELYNITFTSGDKLVSATDDETWFSFALQTSPTQLKIVPLLEAAHAALKLDSASDMKSFTFSINSAAAKTPSKPPTFDSNGGGSNAGKTAGIVIGVLLGVALVGYLLWRHRKKKQREANLRAQVSVQDNNTYHILD